MVSNSKLKEARLEKREIYSFQRNGASSFSLNDVVDAHEEVESNKNVGNVIVTV